MIALGIDERYTGLVGRSLEVLVARGKWDCEPHGKIEIDRVIDCEPMRAREPHDRSVQSLGFRLRLHRKSTEQFEQFRALLEAYALPSFSDKQQVGALYVP